MSGNWLERSAEAAGRAVGAFQKGLRDMAHRTRAAFIGAWADAQRWTGGDWAKRGAQRRAIQNSWIYTAVELIAREISHATFGVVIQTGVDDEPTAVANHPLEQLLRRPNPWMGRAFLWQYSALWLLLDGNAYWFVGRDGAGRPVEIWPLPSQDVEVWPGDEERFIDHYVYTANGTRFEIPAEYVVHIRLPNPFDVFRGLSPLMAAMLAADADTAMARWNGTFFGRDNVMPSAIINISSGDPTRPVNPTDVEALKQDLRSEYTASSRKTAITGANSLDAVLLGWNPKEMDFVQGRQFSKEEILAIYGVPAGLLDKNATEANATVAKAQFMDTVWGYLVIISDELTAELVKPYYGNDQEASFDDPRPGNRLLELQEVAAAGPYLTIDEVRERYWQAGPLPDGAGSKPAVGSGGQDLGFGMDPVGMMGNLPWPDGGLVTGNAQAQAKATLADLARWRDKALRAMKAGRGPAVRFESDVIPGDVAAMVGQRLAEARTAEDVKRAFVNVAPPFGSPPSGGEHSKAADGVVMDDKFRRRFELELAQALEWYLVDLLERVAHDAVA